MAEWVFIVIVAVHFERPLGWESTPARTETVEFVHKTKKECIVARETLLLTNGGNIKDMEYNFVVKEGGKQTLRRHRVTECVEND